MQGYLRKCQLCEAEFHTPEAYDDHLFRVFHLDDEIKSFTSTQAEEKFKCPICEMQLLNRQGLNQHIGKVHTKKLKGSYCSICRKKFKHKYAVRFHVNQVHKQATRVSCPHCSEQIYNKYALKKHILKAHPSA